MQPKRELIKDDDDMLTFILSAALTATAPATGEALTLKMTECARTNAKAFEPSKEPADIVAKAVVGMCRGEIIEFVDFYTKQMKSNDMDWFDRWLKRGEDMVYEEALIVVVEHRARANKVK